MPVVALLYLALGISWANMRERTPAQYADIAASAAADSALLAAGGTGQALSGG